MRIEALIRATLLALAALAAPASAQTAAEWAAATGPAPGVAQAIGGTGLGCLAGAVPLPPEGPGWQAVRLSRNRHWGHPALVHFIEDMARRARSQGFADLWIGDMAQPRGGPMPWGHASHQTGLDVDIWLDLRPKPPTPRAAREEIAVASLVRPDGRGLDPAVFTPAHAALIRLAAETPGVDRVIVHHGIKRGLCQLHGGQAWLRRVRPWRGHESHMHIRLRCPAGSPACIEAPPIAPGDGCDATLDWWLSEEARRPPPRAPGPPPRLPAACAPVLAAR
jgi:penicillin-insensitive murein endopeptidase